MNAAALDALRLRLAAENLTTGDALQSTVVHIADCPEHPEALRRKALIREAGAVAAELLDGWHLTAEQVANQLALDHRDTVPFLRGIAEVWRLSEETGIEWLSLAMVVAERGAVTTEEKVKTL